MKSIRALALLLLPALCAALLGCGSAARSVTGADAQAICAAPTLWVSPRKVRPGGAVKVGGGWWSSGCNDSFTNGSADGPTARPISGIFINLVQAGEAHVLAKVDADADGSFSTTALLPADLAPGKATIRASLERGNGTLRFVETPSGTLDADGQVTIEVLGGDRASSHAPG